MKAEEVRKMSMEELKLEEERLRRQLFDLRCQAVTESLENPMQFRNLRRDIARVKTHKRSLELQDQGKA